MNFLPKAAYSYIMLLMVNLSKWQLGEMAAFGASYQQYDKLALRMD
jgi:hypothetical protein